MSMPMPNTSSTTSVREFEARNLRIWNTAKAGNRHGRKPEGREYRAGFGFAKKKMKLFS